MIRRLTTGTQIPSKEFANLFEKICAARHAGGASC